MRRGYDPTTLPAIANAAGVSTRTIFAYFPSKEDIIFSQHDAMKDALAQAFAARPDDEDALTTVRSFILGAMLADRSELEVQLHCGVSSRSGAAYAPGSRQLEDVIAPAIAYDLNTTTDDLSTKLVVASLIAAFTLTADQGSPHGNHGSPRSRRANRALLHLPTRRPRGPQATAQQTPPGSLASCLAHGTVVAPLPPKQAVKPLLDHLEKRGYLERVPHPDDHRAQRIHTTARGKRLMASPSAIITEIDQDIERQLGRSTHARLRASLTVSA